MPSSELRPGEICVFVCSSDSRRDILERVLPSILKFWPECPYPIYVGVNSACAEWPGTRAVRAPASEWYLETITQLSTIACDYVILVLDDFLFGAPVDQTRMARLIGQAVELRLPYLRLVPLGRSLAARIAGRYHREFQPGIDVVSPDWPFHAALQIAVWEKQHLLAMLRMACSIWDFEHRAISGAMHFAVRANPPIIYRHVVERGRWLPNARTLLQRSGLPADLGMRRQWSGWRYIRLAADQIRWWLLGHATY